MTEHVVYVLGAGFSAPLGLPVMRNFLRKSKDIFFSDPEKYGHFKEVFNTIATLSVSKNYYDVDLFNIEEILSILEMKSFVEGDNLKDDFIRYICDVILHSTPELVPHGGRLPANWQDHLFGSQRPIPMYGHFVSCLLNLEIERLQGRYGGEIVGHVARRSKERDFVYDVVTLNYDLVIENFCDFVNKNFHVESKMSFSAEIKNDAPCIAKLHGSIDTGLIVPPTWAKGTHSEIRPSWKTAYEILMRANHIRFIGYSLPVADSYIKYLLKSSVLFAKHMKNIDVICKDSDGSVQRRYGEFITFFDYRFRNASTQDYLQNVQESHAREGRHLLRFLGLERAHDAFMTA